MVSLTTSVGVPPSFRPILVSVALVVPISSYTNLSLALLVDVDLPSEPRRTMLYLSVAYLLA